MVQALRRAGPLGEATVFARDSRGGLPDLVIAADVWAEATDRTVFAFDGRFYRAAKCFDGSVAAAPGTATPLACR